MLVGSNAAGKLGSLHTTPTARLVHSANLPRCALGRPRAPVDRHGAGRLGLATPVHYRSLRLPGSPSPSESIRVTVPVSTRAPNGASRAVGTHHEPTRIHRAEHATRVRGPHYEPDYGPSHVLHYGPRYRSSYAAMHAGPTTATAPPRRWTGRRTTLDTYIWRSRPRAPGAPEVMTPTCAAGDRTRSAEVYYTAGLNNAGCPTRLRRQAKEERRGPDPSWSRWKAETSAARSVTGRD